MDISGALNANLQEIEPGLWTSNREKLIAYPSSGNARCFQIEEQSFWFQHRNNVIGDLVSRLRPAGTLLDIGGGNGFVSAHLKSLGIDVGLVEPGIEGARNAKARGVPLVINATLEDCALPAGSVAGAGLFDVLEHIKEDVEFLLNVNSLLTRGGLVFLTVPAYQTLWSYEDDYAGHHRRYTLSSLRDVLRSAGLEPVFESYFFGFLPLPIFLTRTFPTLIGLRRSFSEEVCVKEHSPTAPGVTGVLRFLCNRERERLKSARQLSFGASCLVAARKP